MPVAPAVDKMTKGRNAILSALGQGEFEQKALQGKVQAEQVSRKTFKDALKELVRAGAIESFESPRPGTRAAIHWRLPAGDGPMRADTSGVTTGTIPPSDV
jgi:DNA-binding HxlR family transcriptional regulator